MMAKSLWLLWLCQAYAVREIFDNSVLFDRTPETGVEDVGVANYPQHDLELLNAIRNIPTAKPQEYSLLRENARCNAHSFALGYRDNIELCVKAVKMVSGKFFGYGSSIRERECIAVDTADHSCEEGFTSDSTMHFYDLPDIVEEDVNFCSVKFLQVFQSSNSGSTWDLVTQYHPEQQKADEEAAKDEPFNRRASFSGSLTRRVRSGPEAKTFLEVVAVQSEKLLWQKVCSHKWKFTCHGVPALEDWSTCCDMGLKAFGSGGHCVPDEAARTLNRKHQLTEHGQEFEYCPEKRFGYSVISITSQVLSLPQDVSCLKVRVPSIAKTLTQEFSTCPFVEGRISSILTWGLSGQRKIGQKLGILSDKSQASHFKPAVFTGYETGFFRTVVHLVLMKAKSDIPIEKRIALPTTKDYLDRYTVYTFPGVPSGDIDMSEVAGNSLYTGVKAGMASMEKCLMKDFMNMPIEDFTDKSWNDLCLVDGGCPDGMKQCRPKEWVRGVFNGYQSRDGNDLYPRQQVSFDKFRIGDPSAIYTSAWLDAAEETLAFRMIGSHRLRKLKDKETEAKLEGGKCVYALETTHLSGLEVRTGLGTVGVDMFFDQDGTPVMMKKPDGTIMWKSDTPDATWQYWKFVWRSSLLILVTTVDHLWMTHFYNANAAAAASREALPPEHPMRRFLTIFTVGTIKVNANAVHQLVGPGQLLERSMPFKDLYQVTKAAISSLWSWEKAYAPFSNDAVFAELDSKVQNVPMYEDGREMFKIFERLGTEFVDMYRDDWCTPEGILTDPDIQLMFERWNSWTPTPERWELDLVWLGLYPDLTCDGLAKFLSILPFSVSAWHRHVGQVSDILTDPEFASFSWPDGEGKAQPRQTLPLALMISSTALPQVSLLESFEHLMRGIDKQDRAVMLFQQFNSALRETNSNIEKRNKERPFAYRQMMPSEIEVSVAV